MKENDRRRRDTFIDRKRQRATDRQTYSEKKVEKKVENGGVRKKGIERKEGRKERRKEGRKEERKEGKKERRKASKNENGGRNILQLALIVYFNRF